MPPFMQRIRERKVAQWAIAYLAVGWAILGAYDILAEPLGMPTNLMSGLLVLYVAGFVATVIIAWYHGEKGAQRVNTVELLMLAALATAAGGVLWRVRPGDRPEPARAATPAPEAELGSIVVLPCRTLSGTDGRDPLSDAIQDKIITHLVQVSELTPISLISTNTLRDGGFTTSEIADSLNVLHVLDCAVQRNLAEVRVSANLIDARTDRNVWADDREFRVMDLFSLQEEVAGWITEKLLSGIATARVPETHQRASNPAAYELYLDGKYLANSRKQEDMARAIGAYRESLDLDSTYAPVHAAMALTYALWGHYGYSGSYSTYETFGRALRHADQATVLDPRLADGHASRAYLLAKALAPPDTVEAAFNAALALAPSSADVRILYAGFLARERRFDEAIAESHTAIELDPVAPGRDSGLGYNALAARRYELALRAADRANVLEPGLMAPRIIRALSFVMLGRAAECLEIDLGAYAAVRAVCLDAAGQSQEARALMDSVEANPGPRQAALHNASYYAWVGDVGRTLDALEGAYEESPHGLDYRVIASGVFDRVREDPRFRRGLERLRQQVWDRVQRARRP